MCRNSFRIRAERKTGQLLKDTPKQSGARGIGKKADSPAASPLADLGDVSYGSGLDRRLHGSSCARFSSLMVKLPVDWYFAVRTAIAVPGRKFYSSRSLYAHTSCKGRPWPAVKVSSTAAPDSVIPGEQNGKGKGGADRLM